MIEWVRGQGQWAAEDTVNVLSSFIVCWVSPELTLLPRRTATSKERGTAFRTGLYVVEFGTCSCWSFAVFEKATIISLKGADSCNRCFHSPSMSLFISGVLFTQQRSRYLSSVLKSSPLCHRAQGRVGLCWRENPAVLPLIRTAQAVQPPATLPRNFTAATVCCRSEDGRRFLEIGEFDAADNWVLWGAGNSRNHMLFT